MKATFSEPVNGFTTEDIVVTNGTADALTGGLVTFTFNVTPTAKGMVTVSIPAGVAKDYLGKDNIASNQFSITYGSAESVNDTSESGGDSTTSGGGVIISTGGGNGIPVIQLVSHVQCCGKCHVCACPYQQAG